MYSKRVNDIIEKMSIKDKIGQMIQIHPMVYYKLKESNVQSLDLDGDLRDNTIDKDYLYKAGSMLTVKDTKELIEIQKDYLKNNKLGIPLLFMYDVIHGFNTVFPITLGQACSWDKELIKECTEISSKEASVCGQHVAFGPMADLVRDPRWGRVMESFGEDPYFNSCMCKAVVEGFQQNDLSKEYTMAACGKHFAGYGASEGGRDYNVVDISNRWLREFYLKAYKACVDADCKMIMTAFNMIDSIPCSINKHLLKDILRDEWKFSGVVISDWNAIAEALVIGGAEDEMDCTKKAVDALVDIEMVSELYSLNIEKLIKENKLQIKAIDEAVGRILSLKEELGLFENPYRFADIDKAKEICLCKEHRIKAREAAEQSCVLLKNNGILPIRKDIKNLAIIGPFADSKKIIGWWSALGEEKDCISLYEGIKNIVDKSCKINVCGGENINETARIAKEADIVILALGEEQTMSGESGSRGFLDLPDNQQEIASIVKENNSNTVLVLFNGRPLTLEWYDNYMAGILEAWYPGTEGGNAIANILFGNVNPSGKLTMSFPRQVGQIPVYYNSYQVGRPINKEEYTFGEKFERESRYYSTYIDIPNSPLYSFGYGLSYTNYQYDNLILSNDKMYNNRNINILVGIKNTGSYDGYEIVQLYLKDISGSVARPLIELKGFKKIFIKARETTHVSFTINKDMLKFFRYDMTYGNESGKYKVYIGSNLNKLKVGEFYYYDEEDK